MRRIALSALARSCCNADLLKISIAKSYMRSRELLSFPRMFRCSKVRTSLLMDRLTFRQGMNVGCREDNRGSEPELRQVTGDRPLGQLATEGESVDPGDPDQQGFTRRRHGVGPE